MRWMFATLLVGCGADGVHHSRPPADAVASCAVAYKRSGSVQERSEEWFDAAGRLLQSDSRDGSSMYQYDDQDRLVSAKTPYENLTWTYDATRITELSSTGLSNVYDLGSDGRVRHWEGPEEVADAERNKEDFQYDVDGNITSVTGIERYTDTPTGPVKLGRFAYQYAYDDADRLTAVSHDPALPPTTYTYTETPGQLRITLGGDYAGRVYAYAFDDAGRIIRAAVDDNAVTYSYVGDRVTATSGNLEVDAGGPCAGVTTRFGPPDPLPIRLLIDVIPLPNPPVDDFNQGHF